MTAAPTSLQRVTEELAAREPIFHRPAIARTRAEFERMTTADFFEVGASGKKYSREYVLDVLDERGRTQVEDFFNVTDFACRAVSPDTFLATYQLEQAHGRLSRRATLWRRTPEGWVALYHQGTLIAAAETGG